MQTNCKLDAASLVRPFYLCHVTDKGLANLALGCASNPDLRSVQALAAGKDRAACELESGCWHHGVLSLLKPSEAAKWLRVTRRAEYSHITQHMLFCMHGHPCCMYMLLRSSCMNV